MAFTICDVLCLFRLRKCATGTSHVVLDGVCRPAYPDAVDGWPGGCAHALPDMMVAIKCDTNIRNWARKLIDNACRQGNKVSKVFMILCRSLQPTCAVSVKYASMITQ
ncbi:caspace recruitment domain-containing protein [Infectious spleen and kidney necrosis virus]|nr:caspace recruitment domain-containing protein [Infectious spleen and kidney necrosis virus]